MMFCFNRKSVYIRIFAFVLIQAFLGSNISGEFAKMAEHAIDRNCLAPVLQIENRMLVNGVIAKYNQADNDIAEKKQTVLGVFKDQGIPIVEFYADILLEQGVAKSQIEKTKSRLERAFNRAYGYLNPKEKQLLLGTYKKNKKERLFRESIEFSLPIRVESELKESASITEEEIIVNADILQAPPEVATVIFLHAMRKYIFPLTAEYQLYENKKFKKSQERFSFNNPQIRKLWARWKENDALRAFCSPHWPEYFVSMPGFKYINEIWEQLFEQILANDFSHDLMPYTENVLVANEHLEKFIDQVRGILKLPKSLSRPFEFNVGHDRVRAIARKMGKAEYLLILSHQGSNMAADINFHPDNKYHSGNKGFGIFDERQDNHVYEIVEVFDSERPEKNIGGRTLVTGRSLRVFGIGFNSTLPILATKIYRFKKIGTQIPVPDKKDYNELLKYSLLQYKRFSLQDRLMHSFITREIIQAIKKGSREFSVLFHSLSKMIEEDAEIESNELSRVFSDIIFYSDQQIKDRVREYLINIAISDQVQEIEHAAVFQGLNKEEIYSISAHASENAIKLLRSATVGEIVITSPESLWSSGTGGMALQVTDLAKELAELGIPVTVFVPLFNEEPRKTDIFLNYGLYDTGRSINIKFGRYAQETAGAKIYEAYDQGVRIGYLENSRYFNLLKGPDGTESAYNGPNYFRMRFARMLSLGTLLAIRERNIHARVIQTNDWTTAYVKAYLEGRERIDLSLANLKFDAHLNNTEVLSITHNLHRYYQGMLSLSNQWERDERILNDLGFNPEHDIDILVLGFDNPRYDHDQNIRDRAWFDINPTYTAVRTAKHVRDVSSGHHDRSIDPNFELEFGYLSGVLGWKNSVGDYDGMSNGFGLAQRQRLFLRKMLVGPRVVDWRTEKMENSLKQEIRERIPEDIGYKNWLANFFDSPETVLKGFYGINTWEEEARMQRFLNEFRPEGKSIVEFKRDLKNFLEIELLRKTTKVLRSNIEGALENNYYAGEPEFRTMLRMFLEEPHKMSKSFFDIGHEKERNYYAQFWFDFIKPLQKTMLQDVFGLEKGKEKFTYSMLHRVGEQKGHQLLLAEIWDRNDPGSLRALRETFFFNLIESHDYAIGLSDEEKNKLIEFADYHGRKTLRAIEVVMILNPNMQFVVVGSSEGVFDHSFREVFERFKPRKQFAYLPEFISFDSALYELIYSGSDRFGMPSWYEPGGLSNQEAAGYGTPRHLTRRDGLVDGELRIDDFRESFLEFNPVAWLVSTREHERFFRENLQKERQLRYKAITQDNRWLNRARNYIELYRRLCHSEAIPELKSLEMAAAIYQAAVRDYDDPADELMKAGYTAGETIETLLDDVLFSSNEVIVSALIEKHIPFLSKIAEIKPELIKRIEEILSGSHQKEFSENAYKRIELLLINIKKIDIESALLLEQRLDEKDIIAKDLIAQLSKAKIINISAFVLADQAI
ncbi:MAG: glycogen/starch synthase [Candidatus Omnitrophota bacterium]